MASVRADAPFLVTVEEVVLRVPFVLTDRQRCRWSQDVIADSMRGAHRRLRGMNVGGPQEDVGAVELFRRRRHNGSAFNDRPGATQFRTTRIVPPAGPLQCGRGYPATRWLSEW